MLTVLVIMGVNYPASGLPDFILHNFLCLQTHDNNIHFKIDRRTLVNDYIRKKKWELEPLEHQQFLQISLVAFCEDDLL